MPIQTLQNYPKKLGRPPLHTNILPHGNLGHGLTTCYLFNSSPSNYLHDVSPYRHHSRILQNPTNEYWLPSDDGLRSLLLFEAAAQRIDCGFIPKLNGAVTATIAAWIKVRDATSRASVGKGGFNLDVLDDGFTYLGMDGVYGRFPNSDTRWQLIVFTFNGAESVNSNRLRGYKNGVRQNLELNGSFPSDINDDSFNFFYVNYSTEFGVYGTSYYKFVALWNRALNDQEVLELYTDQNYSWLLQQNYMKFGMPIRSLSPHISEYINVSMCVPMDLDYSLEL